MRRLLALALCGTLALTSPVRAQEIIRRNPVLGLVPVLQNDVIEPVCSAAMYQTLIRQPDYYILPDWYMLERLEQNPARWQSDWVALFGQLKEAEYAMLTRLEASAEGPRLVGILLKSANPPQVIRAEVLDTDPGRLSADCEKIARRLLGHTERENFQNPALSATLSVLVPGAGHLYRGGADGILMGVGFLGAYLTMAYLGFSDAAPQLSRSQWGGLLVLLTLVDVVTAYFLAEQK